MAWQPGRFDRTSSPRRHRTEGNSWSETRSLLGRLLPRRSSPPGPRRQAQPNATCGRPSTSSAQRLTAGALVSTTIQLSEINLGTTCAALVLSFVSAEAAAVAGVKEALAQPRADEREFAGAVYRCGDRFGFTKPRTSGQGESVRIEVRLPPGAKLAAIFHTHPGMVSEARFFSEGDTETAARLGVPSYMGIVRSGAVKVLRPGSFRRGYIVAGEPVSIPHLTLLAEAVAGSTNR